MHIEILYHGAAFIRVGVTIIGRHPGQIIASFKTNTHLVILFIVVYYRKRMHIRVSRDRSKITGVIKRIIILALGTTSRQAAHIAIILATLLILVRCRYAPLE